jgi:hypothetical protein
MIVVPLPVKGGDFFVENRKWMVLVSCLRNTLHYSDAVQGLFASDIEHFGSQTDAERRVKNHRLFEGLKARVSVS